MWTRISIDSIQPGLRMCDELSVSSSDSRQITGLLKKLNQWSDYASENVRKIVGDVSFFVSQCIGQWLMTFAETKGNQRGYGGTCE